jgi:two-component system, OmpR family, response regulator
MDLEQQPRQTQKVDYLLQGLQIVIVDNDLDSRDLLSFALETEGATVIALASAQTALEHIAHHPPDALLCEIILPQEDGCSLIHKLKQLEVKHQRRIPTIAVTTQGSISDQIRIMQAGFQFYLIKPINLDQLIQTVAHVKGWDLKSSF